MFQLGKTVVSEDILKCNFVCDLQACKGNCCIDGEAGAPLEADEIEVLKKIYPKVKEFLTEAGVKAIEKQGVYVTSKEGELETPLIDGADCAYVVRGEDQQAHCAIELASAKGKGDWKKPISCHLYPIRIKQFSHFCAVNYHRWEICSSACELGKQLNIPVYKFLKEALVRKFGEAWYAELEKVAQRV